MVALALAGAGAGAETIRVATWHANLSRKGPGLLLRDILRRDDAILAIAATLVSARPDVIVLTDMDYDAGGQAGRALTEMLADLGLDLPHHDQPRPNTGMASGLDLDRNGKLGEARDAQGYGRFPGDGGVTILSRWPIRTTGIVDHSAMLWRDLPDTRLTEQEREDDRSPVQRLGTAGHWIVPIDGPVGRFDLWVFAATPPVFDGPDDRNGRRNGDEIALWRHVLHGALPGRGAAPFVIAGLANLDPADGEGLHEAINTLLAHPDLQDPRPSSAGAAQAATPGQTGDPAVDTADFTDPLPGNLRLSYVLPSIDWSVQGAGVWWHAQPESMSSTNRAAPTDPPAERHKLVWVDITLDQAVTNRTDALAVGE